MYELDGLAADNEGALQPSTGTLQSHHKDTSMLPVFLTVAIVTSRV